MTSQPFDSTTSSGAVNAIASKGHILLVEDDLHSRKSTQKILELENYRVSSFENPEEALKFLALPDPHGENTIQVILSDIRMPKMSGLEFLKALSTLGEKTPVILMTAFGSVEDAVWAMKWGVIDFLTKPFKRVDVLESVEVALKRGLRQSLRPQALAESAGAIQSKYSTSSEMNDWIGKTPIFLRLKENIQHVAPTQATVLITGQSGTGKERVARELHSQSARAKGPFIALNCAALPENLLESELFGFEKGSFTGADQARVGLFEAAHQGTLFLDEIGEMSLSLQAKLLRVLSDGEVRRIGSSASKKVSVRLVTATHRNLRERVREGSFREDLLYRLEVVHLEVPALKDRVLDIPELALHFIRHFSLKHEKKVYGISDEALDCLLNYSWPGNIRELQNAVERAVVFAKSDEISARDFPETVRSSLGKPSQETSGSHISIRVGMPLKEVEELLIRKTLELSQGDKTLTAKLLGINQRTIYRKLQEKEDSE
jgi:two-component system, NtrC family, response regulator HydG